MQPFIVTAIITNDNGIAVFSEEIFESHLKGGMFLTEQIASKNFRIRRSNPGYTTDFHLSGDATLIIIQKGCLKIELQNGDYKLFNAGDFFIAKDNLPSTIVFDNTIHGHKASVIGNEALQAIHVKL
jgi:hypothetical protein